MMLAAHRATALRREPTAAQRIPYAAHVTPAIIRTTYGDYLQAFRLGGASFESADDEQLNNWHERLNVLWRNIASPNVALWSQVIRRRERTAVAAGRSEGFAAGLEAKYRGRLVGETLMVNELYLAILYRPTAGIASGLVSKVLAKTQRQGSQLELTDALDACEKLAQTLRASLARYEPELLKTYRLGNVWYSALLEYLGLLINGEWQRVVLPRGPLSQVLATTRLLFGAEALEYRSLQDIYRRLTNLLRDEQETADHAEPSWLLNLRADAAFLDHMDRLVDASNDIYVGDEPRLVSAFKIHEQISFLEVEPWQVPQVQDLLSACGIPKVSAVAKYKWAGAQHTSLDTGVTARIQQRVRHFMRAVYARAHGVFERARKQGLWQSIASLEVRTVERLEVEAEVAGYRAQVPTDIYRQGQVIYIQSHARGKLDKISQELCLYLGAKPDELSEILFRVLAAENGEELQDFFDVKGIPDIPSEELENILEGEDEAPQPNVTAVRDGLRGHAYGTQEREVATTLMDTFPSESATSESTVAKAPAGMISQATSAQPPEYAPDGPSSHGASVADAQEELPAATAQRRTAMDRTASGRLLSYAEPALGSSDGPASPTSYEEKLSVAKIAVEFVLEFERRNGYSVVEMPFANEGFDIRRGAGGAEEYIEVKGLTGAWSAEGIVLTPAELRMAERQRARYWLYVVEYAVDPSLRRLYRIQDPFGKTSQFRFDAGWKGVTKDAARVLDPIPGRFVSIEDIGIATILNVVQAGILRRITVRLDSGQELTRTYDPAKMHVTEGV